MNPLLQEFNRRNFTACFDLMVEAESPMISNFTIRDAKDDAEAVQLKNVGNTHFQERKFEKALEYYTLSIAKAKSAAVLAISYGNRSAALFRLKLYQECITDIERALGTDCYPNVLKPKLNTRRADSLKLRTPREPYFEPIPPVKGSPNPRIQAAGDCVEIRVNEEFGRHVVGTQSIAIGDVIAVESPFTNLLLIDLWVNCHHCLHLCYNPIPCEKCTLALFCSKGCKVQAFESYHKYECPIISALQTLNRFCRLALRLTLMARDCLSNDNQNNCDNVYRSDRYKEISRLSTYVKLQGSTMIVLSRDSAKIFLLMKKFTDFFKHFPQNHIETQFKERLLLHTLICFVNVMTIERLEGSIDLNATQIGLGIYSFLSFFSHSCVPNVLTTNYGNDIVLKAAGTIAKGQQCFISYIGMFKSKAERQNFLSTRFFFECKCRKCSEDWTSNPALFRCLDGFYYCAIFKNLLMGDLKMVKSNLPRVLSDFRRLEHLELRSEAAYLLDVIQRFYLTLGNKRRYFSS